jgi:hypothetical protein
MQLPRKTEFPFFAYGVFKPGELGFLRIKEFLDPERRPLACSVPGQLWVRDGLPIAHLRETNCSQIPGYLIYFRNGSGSNAYARIAELEPDYQYKWSMKRPAGEDAYILEGRNPEDGGERYGDDWKGEKDPLFTIGLDVIQEIWEQNHGDAGDHAKLFKLEAAYLLLWSAIERYASLRYHLSDRVEYKVEHIIQDPAFSEALLKYVDISRPRIVRSANDPSNQYELNPSDPAGSYHYYRQIRHNTSHRGKSAGSADHSRLSKSLYELLNIFKDLLKKAFDESKSA